MSVKKGDKVKVEYTGTLEDGEIFDSSEKHGQALEFEVGGGQVIPGFENAVVGMEVGEEKQVKIEPEEGYGHYDPQRIKEVPREQLPEGQEPKSGMMLMMGLPNGAQMPAVISKVMDETVTIDVNHPLAGKTLNFRIKVVEVSG